MIYSVYAYSSLGAQLTSEVFGNLGYSIKSYNFRHISGQDQYIGLFRVDTNTKLVKFSHLKLTKYSKQLITEQFNSRRAFRSTEVILKYLK